MWKSIHHKGHEEHEEKKILSQRTQEELGLRSVRQPPCRHHYRSKGHEALVYMYIRTFVYFVIFVVTKSMWYCQILRTDT